MATVFLSYDRDDAAKAQSFAAALEKAGHSVWWDRHIHGGAAYNDEIEAAVETASAVVVLWSERSIRSTWVRDEAAEGRDQNKLVPVLLDAVKPPMGFRQFQTIDLTRSGRAPSTGSLQQILESIDRVAGIWSLVSEYEPEQPHWYLRQIGVDPALHSGGRGGLLMEAGLAEIDRRGELSYLEATSPRSRDFYERYGFVTLADTTDVYYHMGSSYVPDAARGIRWDDPALSIDWPVAPTTMSEADARYPDLDPRAFDLAGSGA